MRELGHDHFRQLDPVRSFQSQVRDNQMRFHFADDIHPFAGAARFAANREAVVGIEQLDQAMPEKRMIVHDHDPDRLRQRTLRVRHRAGPEGIGRFHIRLDGLTAGLFRVRGGSGLFAGARGLRLLQFAGSGHGHKEIAGASPFARIILQFSPTPHCFDGITQVISIPPLLRRSIFNSPPREFAR